MFVFHDFDLTWRSPKFSVIIYSAIPFLCWVRERREVLLVAFELNPDPGFLSKQALVIRRDIIHMLGQAGSGHTGGSLSMTDLITALYFAELKHDPARPNWPDRDRFLLSKGHGAPALYAILARTGYFSVEILSTLRQHGSMLQGHPDMNKTPGIECSTGSLGQGLSMACGMAVAARLRESDPAYRVYTLLGDGELNEGQVWEAAMSAAHYGLDNLCAMVDYNGLQIDGETCKVNSLEPLADKWKAFGWNVISINGHDVNEILSAFGRARLTARQPTVILAKTVKGKGVSFIENQAGWHGIAPKPDEVKKALEELR
ncbi:transketolase [bacterium]|nr:transketolase [bacterium]